MGRLVVRRQRGTNRSDLPQLRQSISDLVELRGDAPRQLHLSVFTLDFPSDPESCHSVTVANRHAIVGAEIAVQLSKGDRVKLSPEGLARLHRLSHPKTFDRTDRRGTVTQLSKTGSSIYVLWDDRRSTEALHSSYLERADEFTEALTDDRQ
jgi:hypothetical protein